MLFLFAYIYMAYIVTHHIWKSVETYRDALYSYDSVSELSITVVTIYSTLKMHVDVVAGCNQAHLFILNILYIEQSIGFLLLIQNKCKKFVVKMFSLECSGVSGINCPLVRVLQLPALINTML